MLKLLKTISLLYFFIPQAKAVNKCDLIQIAFKNDTVIRQLQIDSTKSEIKVCCKIDDSIMCKELNIRGKLYSFKLLETARRRSEYYWFNNPEPISKDRCELTLGNGKTGLLVNVFFIKKGSNWKIWYVALGVS